MSIKKYRPWGQLNWLLDKCSCDEWDIIGCLSTEERCIAVFEELKKLKKIGNSYILKIDDPITEKEPNHPYTGQINAKITVNYNKFLNRGLSPKNIFTHKLFERRDRFIKALEDFINKSGKNIIIDISTLPKRFFYPAIKILLRNAQLNNFLATYSIPKKYASGEMSEDYEEWRTLPLFEEAFPPPKNKVIFVGVGHMAMGLPEQIEDAAGEVDVRVFVPFPGDPHSFSRNWNFVRNIEKNLNPGRIKLKRVNARDVPEVFDYIKHETNNGQLESLFAPYGPKPISLGMCLFSCLTNSPVYYTQPRIYHPEYSIGINIVDDEPQIYSYSIKIQGRNLYSIDN